MFLWDGPIKTFNNSMSKARLPHFLDGIWAPFCEFLRNGNLYDREPELLRYVNIVNMRCLLTLAGNCTNYLTTYPQNNVGNPMSVTACHEKP